MILIFFSVALRSYESEVLSIDFILSCESGVKADSDSLRSLTAKSCLTKFNESSPKDFC